MSNIKLTYPTTNPTSPPFAPNSLQQQQLAPDCSVDIRNVNRGTSNVDRASVSSAQQNRNASSNVSSTNHNRFSDVERSGDEDNDSDDDDVEADCSEDEEPTSLQMKGHRQIRSKEELMAENMELRSTITCRRCHEEKVQTLFLPCRHLVVCEACANKMDDCIVCNKSIMGTVKTFFG